MSVANIGLDLMQCLHNSNGTSYLLNRRTCTVIVNVLEAHIRSYNVLFIASNDCEPRTGTRVQTSHVEHVSCIYENQ